MPGFQGLGQAGSAAARAGGPSVKEGGRAGKGGSSAADSGDDDDADERPDVGSAGRGGSSGTAKPPADDDMGESAAAGRKSSAGSAGQGASAGSGAGASAGRGASEAGRAASDAPRAGNGGGSQPDQGQVDGSRTLASIKTDAEAQAVCAKMRADIRDSDLRTIERGSCTLDGLIGELQGLGQCAALTAQCLDEATAPEPDEGCTTDDIPSCTNVTVDEFLACAKASLASSVAFFGAFSCTTDLEQLTEPPTPAACTAAYAKCPELEGEQDGSSES